MACHKRVAAWLFAGTIGLMGLVLWSGRLEVVAGNVTTRIAPTGDAIEMDIPTDIGVQKDLIPLYRSGEIRYFSAGIGRAERDAAYPSFSLKLVFTAGGKPFVTGVTVTVRDDKGANVLTVSSDRITGPWLFVDLPEGTYEVTAVLGGHAQVEKGIKLKPGKSLTHHVRWAEDHSPPLVVQPD
jgi:hypothetical protein